MGTLVTISREYGSGGRIVGEIVAQKLGIPFYDKKVIDMVVEESGFDKALIEKAELKAKSGLVYSWTSAATFNEVVGASPLSMNDKLFLAQFQAIQGIGEKGDGVIVGRCADYVLRDCPNVTNVFIHCDFDGRMARAIKEYGDNPKKISSIINSYDKARRNYYNYHTGQKWGDYSNYDLSINTSYISEEKAANLIVEFVNSRIREEE